MYDRLTSPFSNWAIEPKGDEPAHGYFGRLVDGEGHNSLRVYSTWIEVNGRNIVPSAMLDVICSLPISDDRRRRLAHATPVEKDGMYSLAGQRFALRDLSFSTRRWCAACLAEKAYHRSWWDIVAIRRCPYHDREIVDRDIDGQPVGWWWPRFDVTKSGHDLASERVPRVLLHGTFAAYLLMRMGYEERWHAPLLDRLDATDAIDICHLVGRLVSNPKSEDIPGLTTRTIDAGYRALRRDRAYLVAVIMKWLGKCVPHADVDNSYSNVFGWAYQQARALPDVPTRRMLLAVFRKAHSAVLTGSRTVDADDDTAISLTTLAEDLGVDRRGVASLVTALSAVDGGRRGKRRVSLDASQAASLKREVVTLLTRNEAGDLLGLPGWAVEYLVMVGYLHPVSNIGRETRGLRFTRRQVGEVLWRIEELSTVGGGSRKFLTYWRSGKLHPGDVAVAVLKGEVRVCRREAGQRGFQSLHIAVGMQRVKPSSSSGISMADAEAITNLNRDTLRWLVNNGNLGDVSRTSKLCLLSREIVERFADRYRNVAEFSLPLGMTNSELVRQLADKGVLPIVSAADGALFNTVVEKERVIAALGLECDPTIIEDKDLARFWSALVAEARIRCPQFKFPDLLPSCGQRVWRGDRRGSVLFEFDPVSSEIHYRLIGRRFLEDRNDDGRQRRLAVNKDPGPIIDLIS